MANSDWAREPKQTFWGWCFKQIRTNPPELLKDHVGDVWVSSVSRKDFLSPVHASFCYAHKNGVVYKFTANSFSDLKSHLSSDELKASLPND